MLYHMKKIQEKLLNFFCRLSDMLENNIPTSIVPFSSSMHCCSRLLSAVVIVLFCPRDKYYKSMIYDHYMAKKCNIKTKGNRRATMLLVMVIDSLSILEPKTFGVIRGIDCICIM